MRIRRLLAGRAGTTCSVLFTGPGWRNEWGEWVRPRPYGELRNVRIMTTPMGRDRAIGEDGLRLDATRLVWSHEPLFEGSTDRDGDLIEFQGERWRVTKVDRWPGFYEAELTRLERQEVPTGPPDNSATWESTGGNPFERALRRLVALGAGLVTLDDAGEVTAQDVIPANAPGPAPRGAFATVYVQEESTEGQTAHYRTYQDPADPDLTRTTTGAELRASVTISFWRAGSSVLANRFIVWSDSPAGLLEEQRLGLTLHRPFRRRRVDDMQGDRIEERNLVEFEATRIETVDQDTGAIRLVGIQLDLDAAGGVIREDIGVRET